MSGARGAEQVRRDEKQVPRQKQVAFTFDDAPVADSQFFKTRERTLELIRVLKATNIPQVMIFANACKKTTAEEAVDQLKLYTEAGHLIGNHSCSHPRLDEVGAEVYIKDILEGEKRLEALLSPQKYFRYPFLNEGNDTAARDAVRDWLIKYNYRNGFVSLDNDDYVVTERINTAAKLGKKINHAKVSQLLIKHVISASEFYDRLAVKTLGYSPKHVVLLHEVDATVMALEDLAKEYRRRGWKIISIEEAFKDPIYFSAPKNTYANNGLIAQLAFEKTGMKEAKDFYNYKKLLADINELLGLPQN